MTSSLVVVDRFAPEASRLRDAFDERFGDPKIPVPGRFVWDYWHVPGQYTALRTPAYAYFPKRLYDAFHQRLVWWGRRTLGCHDVSPPWLSLYVEGCTQEWHGDVPHGPWAFVFSLTRWRGRRFSGGETVLLNEAVLEYWEHFHSDRGLEEPELVRDIAPEFNRLTVFDPRIPHRVRTVRGTHDPREGRLVVHGWFMQPRPFIEGPLKTRALEAQLPRITRALTPWLEHGLRLSGMQSLDVRVRGDGRVSSVKVLADTLRVPAEDRAELGRLRRAVQRACHEFQFPRQARASRITLPLVFERVSST